MMRLGDRVQGPDGAGVVVEVTTGFVGVQWVDLDGFSRLRRFAVSTPAFLGLEVSR